MTHSSPTKGIVFALADVEGADVSETAGQSAWTEELNLSDEARKAINNDPTLLSLLYDLDLLPEQLLSQDEKTPGLVKAYHRLYGVLYGYFAFREMPSGRPPAPPSSSASAA